jgi:hypothetical protein
MILAIKMINTKLNGCIKILQNLIATTVNLFQATKVISHFIIQELLDSMENKILTLIIFIHHYQLLDQFNLPL